MDRLINIVDCELKDFLKVAKSKDIITFGAGRKFKSFIQLFDLQNRIVFGVDSDKNKADTDIIINGKSIAIKSFELFKTMQLDKDKIVLLITNRYCIMEIVDELDNMHNWDGADCYICALMEEKYTAQEIYFPNYDVSIPKKIHYCWFGNKEMPYNLKKNVEEWQEKCPDYKIIRWDEKNYDVSKNMYMKQAYEAGKWGFVPDYARLDIIANEGGIYLDTDVKIIKPLDDLLRCYSFMGYVDNVMVALGLGFGAVCNNPLICEMRDYYNDKHFIKKDGSLDMRACVEYQYPVLKKWGYKMNNTQQEIDGNIVYPSEVLNPLGKVKFHTCFTENTHTVHDAQISWEDDAIRSAHEKTIQGLRNRVK